MRPFGVGSEVVSVVSRFLACEVRPLPKKGTSCLFIGKLFEIFKSNMGLVAVLKNQFNNPNTTPGCQLAVRFCSLGVGTVAMTHWQSTPKNGKTCLGLVILGPGSPQPKSVNKNNSRRWIDHA